MKGFVEGCKFGNLEEILYEKKKRTIVIILRILRMEGNYSKICLDIIARTINAF